MLLKITHRDIRTGVHQSCRFCPIANAVRHILKPDDLYCTVGRDRVKIRRGRGLDLPQQGEVLHEVFLPEIAQQFIKAFDRYKLVEPIEFEFDIPQEYVGEADVSRVSE